jgi:hypothetical protein
MTPRGEYWRESDDYHIGTCDVCGKEDVRIVQREDPFVVEEINEGPSPWDWWCWKCYDQRSGDV